MANVMMPQRKDPLDTLVKGLQVAQGVFGVYSDWKKIGQMNRAEEAADKEAQGVLTKRGEAELAAKGLRKVEAAGPDTVAFKDESGKDVFYTGTKLEKPEKAPKAEWQEYQEVAGGPTKKGRWDPVKGLLKTPEDPIIKIPDKKAAGEGGLDGKGTDFKLADNLRTEYDKQSLPTRERLRGYKTVFSAATNPNPTAATDMSLVYAYVRVLDPGSAVKEGEYALVEQSRSIPDSVKATVKRVTDGERLTTEQREAFLAEADRIVKGSLDMQKDTDQRYTDLAATYKVDPKNVVDPAFSRLSGEVEKTLSERAIKKPVPVIGAGPGVLAPKNGGDDPKILEYARQYGVAYQDAEAILLARGYRPGMAQKKPREMAPVAPMNAPMIGLGR